jgi:hypothetical protein
MRRQAYRGDGLFVWAENVSDGQMSAMVHALPHARTPTVCFVSPLKPREISRMLLKIALLIGLTVNMRGGSHGSAMQQAHLHAHHTHTPPVRMLAQKHTCYSRYRQSHQTHRQ